MIIWSGKGLWTPVLIGAGAIIGGAVCGSGLRARGLPPDQSFYLGSIIGLVPAFVLGLKWNREDRIEGRRKPHTLYFIPVEIWSLIIACLFAALAFKGKT